MYQRPPLFDKLLLDLHDWDVTRVRILPNDLLYLVVDGLFGVVGVGLGDFWEERVELSQ